MFKHTPDARTLARLEAIKAAAPVKFADQSRHVERGAQRRKVFKFGIALFPSGDEAKCIVKDISAEGAKLTLEGAIGLPAEFTLAIDGFGAPTKAALVWQSDNEAGIKFV